MYTQKPAQGSLQNSFIHNCPNTEAASQENDLQPIKNVGWRIQKAKDSSTARANELWSSGRQGVGNLKYTLQCQVNNANRKGERNPTYNLNYKVFWCRHQEKGRKMVSQTYTMTLEAL